MLTINGNILAKDFTDEILVDGINVWNQDAMQFSLYILTDASNSIKEELGVEELRNAILVFPFQCGIKYAPGYHLLNIRDCIGITTLEELKKAWKGEI